MKKYKVLDLFCGCGGLSEGFKLAGFSIIGGIDFNLPAINTFNHNFKGAIGICCDLLQIDKDYILTNLKELLKVDVIIGGPPCQGFSSANRWQKELSDPRNKLFFEFVKFVDLLKPKAVLIENVRGIISRDNGYAKKRIEEIFQKRGYYISSSILDASEYGVPQKRLRNFFVALQKKMFDFKKIKKSHRVFTVKDAIGELYALENDISSTKTLVFAPQNPYTKFLRSKSNTIYNAEIRYPAKNVQERISYVPQGGNWQDVPIELWPTQRNNRHSSAYKRLNENSVSVTIDTGNNHSNYFHPIFNRIPTVREAARLQSFPDSFEFLGNRSEQYRQVGNAVPPLLARAIAMAIKKELASE